MHNIFNIFMNPHFVRAFMVILLLVVILWAVSYIFNRAPHRITPGDNVIVSPAMGKVIAIRDITDANLTFFKGEIQNDISIEGVTLPAHVVFIELSLRDVHAQRAPISGVVTHQDFYPGKNKNALSKKTKYELVNTNEKMLTLFKNDDETVGVIQVAGIAARRIRSSVHEGQLVQKGEVFGRILLGSQVVLIIPQTRALQVTAGDLLIDGETIIAY